MRRNVKQNDPHFTDEVVGPRKIQAPTASQALTDCVHSMLAAPDLALKCGHTSLGSQNRDGILATGGL